MADKDKPTYAAEYVKGDWNNAVFLDSVHADSLTSVVLSLGTELWMTRRRLLVLEKLLEKKNLVARTETEAYEPTAAEQVAWDAERDDFISRIFDVLNRQGVKVVGPHGPDAPTTKPMTTR
jgi:hypothetical protein